MTLRDASGGPARNSRQRQAVDRVLRHAQRQRLGSAQHQPRIERAQNRAGGVLNEPQPLDVFVAHGDDDAADRIAVAVQILRRAVHDEVGAECRSGAAGRGWQTCCRRRAARPARARSRPCAAMSVEPQHRVGRRLDEHQLASRA